MADGGEVDATDEDEGQEGHQSCERLADKRGSAPCLCVQGREGVGRVHLGRSPSTRGTASKGLLLFLVKDYLSIDLVQSRSVAL